MSSPPAEPQKKKLKLKRKYASDDDDAELPNVTWSSYDKQPNFYLPDVTWSDKQTESFTRPTKKPLNLTNSDGTDEIDKIDDDDDDDFKIDLFQQKQQKGKPRKYTPRKKTKEPKPNPKPKFKKTSKTASSPSTDNSEDQDYDDEISQFSDSNATLSPRDDKDDEIDIKSFEKLYIQAMRIPPPTKIQVTDKCITGNLEPDLVCFDFKLERGDALFVIGDKREQLFRKKESEHLERLLKTEGCAIKWNNLDVADYWVCVNHKQCDYCLGVVEHKTPDDLLASLSDKRYYEQKLRLKSVPFLRYKFYVVCDDKKKSQTHARVEQTDKWQTIFTACASSSAYYDSESIERVLLGIVRSIRNTSEKIHEGSDDVTTRGIFLEQMFEGGFKKSRVKSPEDLIWLSSQITYGISSQGANSFSKQLKSLTGTVDLYRSTPEHDRPLLLHKLSFDEQTGKHMITRPASMLFYNLLGMK